MESTYFYYKSTYDFKKEKPPEKVQSRLLNVAKRLFLEKGFSGTSISQIAEEAKISKALIYHYFENKEDLWKKVKNRFYYQFLKNFDVTHVKNREDFVRTLMSSHLHQQKNFDFYQFILWQIAEEKEKGFKNLHKNLEWGDWILKIKELQKKDEICTLSEPYFVLLFTLGISSSPWTLSLLDKADDQKKEIYFKTIQKISSDILKSIPLPYELGTPT